ncbi:hypothetical protein A7U60_g1014 [Sanghuangporus baumii]|uniref:Alpha/beta hydrolase fold-3 domain-containing protein n=1 Tax=Sanghuangporus baumii TaxID=108892 RepID=A0A9Q5I4Q2_SANBA|nr:hypothetical protein A7U60_g1014 [Sanghuangporus baumii]
MKIAFYSKNYFDGVGTVFDAKLIGICRFAHGRNRLVDQITYSGHHHPLASSLPPGLALAIPTTWVFSVPKMIPYNPILGDRYFVPPHNGLSHFIAGLCLVCLRVPYDSIPSSSPRREQLIAVMSQLKAQMDHYLENANLPHVMPAQLVNHPPRLAKDISNPYVSITSNMGNISSLLKNKTSSDGKEMIVEVADMVFGHRLPWKRILFHCWSLNSEMRLQVQASDVWDEATIHSYLSDVRQMMLAILDAPSLFIEKISPTTDDIHHQTSDHDRKLLPFPGDNFTRKIHHTSYNDIAIDPTDLAGRVVFISGAGSSLGCAAALACARAGATGLILTARTRSLDALENLENQINHECPEATVLKVAMDIRDADSIASAVSATRDTFGSIDTLLNVGGYVDATVKLTESDLEDWWTAMETNVRGSWAVTQSLLPLLKNSPSGVKWIVNYSSFTAHNTTSLCSGYGVSKLALLHLTEVLSVEFSSSPALSNINTVALFPGLVRSPMTLKSMPAALHDALIDTPELSAESMIWIVKERRDWLSGRFVSCTWDLAELAEKREEIKTKEMLKMNLKLCLDGRRRTASTFFARFHVPVQPFSLPRPTSTLPPSPYSPQSSSSPSVAKCSMFEFRRQPFRTLYMTYFITSTLLVRLPYWVITAIPPFLRPRKTWSFGRSIFVPGIRAFVSTWYATSFPPAPGADPETIANSPDAAPLGFVWVSPLPTDLISKEIGEMMKAQGVEAQKTFAYWYQREGVKSSKDRKSEPNEKIILHFHGGGYVQGSAHPKGGAIGPVSSGLLQHCHGVSRVFAGGYRVSSSAPFPSKNPWPAALLDGLACYYYLIHDMGFSASNVIVSGDSAGGHLALAIARYIGRGEHDGKGLPTPGALLLLSPTVEWGVTHTGKDSSMVRNRRTDYCGQFFQGYTQRSLLGSFPTSYAFTSQWISPASRQLPKDALENLFTGLPRKVYLLAGEAEICLDSYRTLKERLVGDLGEECVKYNEVSDATHDFITMPWHEPERTEALRDIGAWIDSL